MAESSTTPPTGNTSAQPAGTSTSSAPMTRRRGGSLRRRLPLVMTLFLLAIVGAGATASYLEVRESVLDAARGRLQTNGRSWSTILAQSMAQRVDEARRAAASPELQRLLTAADPATIAAAQARLDALLKAAPQNMSVEL